jgi:hypothetical protein
MTLPAAIWPSEISAPWREGYSQSDACLLYTACSVLADNLSPETIMLERITSERRLLGFDVGDWLMLIGGFILAGSLALFV